MNRRKSNNPLLQNVLWTVAILSWVVSAAAASEGKSFSSRKSPDRTLVETFAVAPRGGLIYEMSIFHCDKRRCPVQVRLLKETQVYGTLELDWEIVPAEPVMEKADESSGAGDPLQTQYEFVAWETGEENNNVSIVARTVKLTSQLNGLLIHQRAGFEHLKRRHYLIVAIGNKLVRAWTGDEGNGPTWSTVAVTNNDRSGGQKVIFFRGFRSPDGPSDSLESIIYYWNMEHNAMEEALGADDSEHLYAVIASTEDDLSKVREMPAAHECLRAFWALKSDQFPSLKAGQFVLAHLSSRRTLADKAVESIHACAPGLKPFVLKIQYQPHRQGGTREQH